MASAFNGVEYAASLNPISSLAGPGISQRGNNVYSFPSSYVLLGTEGAPVTLTMGKIPAGAVVVGGQIWATADQGATATFAVGVTGTTGKYMVATLLHTACVGPSGLYSTTTGPEFVYGVANGWEAGRQSQTADDTVLVTIASASPTAGTLFLIMYALMN